MCALYSMLYTHVYIYSPNNLCKHISVTLFRIVLGNRSDCILQAGLRYTWKFFRSSLELEIFLVSTIVWNFSALRWTYKIFVVPTLDKKKWDFQLDYFILIVYVRTWVALSQGSDLLCSERSSLITGVVSVFNISCYNITKECHAARHPLHLCRM